jgi:surfactin synthase thioesterase subunit
VSAARNPWLLSGATTQDDTAAPALLCIPHLGGNAAVFGWWSMRLAPGVRVLPVQLPGRGSRSAERPLRSIAEIAEALALNVAPELRGTYALYGHSLGAIIAFEFARVMDALGRPPEHLFVGACRAPDAPLDRPFLHDAPDDALLDYLRGMDGTPDALIADAGLRATVLDAVRADLEAWETYRFVEGGRLASPITAIAGADDRSVSAAEMRGWGRHSDGGFRLATVPGGHFFLRDARDEVLGIVASAMPGRAAA